jgi:hypothetical protein
VLRDSFLEHFLYRVGFKNRARRRGGPTLPAGNQVQARAKRVEGVPPTGLLPRRSEHRKRAEREGEVSDSFAGKGGAEPLE